MSCRICGSKDISFFLKPYNYDFEVFRCDSCGAIFRFPMPSKDEILSFYTEGYFSGDNSYSYIDERNVRGSDFVWRKRIEKLVGIYSKFNGSKPKNILDIGCSFGGLLETAKCLGMDVYGVEISDYAANYAISRGIKVYKGHVDDVNLPKDYFDIITMIEVIEHLDNPLETLRKLFLSSSRGGLILVQTANIEGGQSRLFGSRYHYYLPGHLHYFSNKTLRSLLFEVGYKKVFEFYPVEFGLFPKLAKVYFSNEGMYRYLKILKTAIYHLLGKVKFGDFSLMSSMVMIGVK